MVTRRWIFHFLLGSGGTALGRLASAAVLSASAACWTDSANARGASFVTVVTWRSFGPSSSRAAPRSCLPWTPAAKPRPSNRNSAPASLSPRQQRVVGSVFCVASIGSGGFSCGSPGDSFSCTCSLEQQRRKDALQKARRYRQQSHRRNCPCSQGTGSLTPRTASDSALRGQRRQRTPSPNSEAITDNLTSTQRRTVHGLHDGCVQELGRPLSLHQALECSAFLTQARRPAPVRCRIRRPERRSPSRPGAAARSRSCSPPLAVPPQPIQTSDEQAGSSDTTHGGGEGNRRCRSFHRLGVAGLAIRMALGHELTRRSERSASLRPRTLTVVHKPTSLIRQRRGAYIHCLR